MGIDFQDKVRMESLISTLPTGDETTSWKKKPQFLTDMKAAKVLSLLNLSNPASRQETMLQCESQPKPDWPSATFKQRDEHDFLFHG